MALSTTRTLLTQTGIKTHQVFNMGGINAVGVVTATKFVGDISDATGAAAGLGTALSQTQTDPHNKIYYTNKVLSISTTTTIDHPATTNIAYTQYGDIKIEDGHDLIIKDGDELRPDVLGLSTTKTLDTNNFPDGLRGNLIGNVTGDVTGNVTGNLAGNVTGNITGDLVGNADTASGLSGNPSINTSGTITATSINDSIGELRNFPQVSVSSNRVLVSGDAGKHVINTGSGGWTINTSSNFSVGDVIRIINASDSSQILYQAGGVTIYSRRDGGVSGDHSIVDRGAAIIICTGSNEYYVSGDI